MINIDSDLMDRKGCTGTGYEHMSSNEHLINQTIDWTSLFFNPNLTDTVSDLRNERKKKTKKRTTSQ